MFITTMNTITNVFQHSAPNQAITGLEDVKEWSHPILVFSNQYFSQHEDTDALKPVPFSDDVDPYGILQGIEEGIHTADNEVQYFERIAKGEKLYISFSISCFLLRHR